jgi:hypothetical protein
LSVAILRLPDGQDYSKLNDEMELHAYDNGGYSPAASSQELTKKDRKGFLRIDSNVSIAQLGNQSSEVSFSAIGEKEVHWLWNLFSLDTVLERRRF